MWGEAWGVQSMEASVPVELGCAVLPMWMDSPPKSSRKPLRVAFVRPQRKGMRVKSLPLVTDPIPPLLPSSDVRVGLKVAAL